MTLRETNRRTAGQRRAQRQNPRDPTGAHAPWRRADLPAVPASRSAAHMPHLLDPQSESACPGHRLRAEVSLGSEATTQL